ncbi:MAG TPA: hypothetical protein VL490_10805 [Mucilaginibacter sp.]|jgi:hypothetical protein|nr:hypothetical protein [Mucilaginibacter sp.]
MILTQIDSSTSFSYSLFIVAIITAFFLGVFLLIRSIMLWYWKVDVIVNNQIEQNRLLSVQVNLQEKQNKLLKQLIDQTGNDSIDPNA